MLLAVVHTCPKGQKMWGTFKGVVCIHLQGVSQLWNCELALECKEVIVLRAIVWTLELLFRAYYFVCC